MYVRQQNVLFCRTGYISLFTELNTALQLVQRLKECSVCQSEVLLQTPAL